MTHPAVVLIIAFLFLATPNASLAQEYSAEISLGSGGAKIPLGSRSPSGVRNCPDHLWIPLTVGEIGATQVPPPPFTITLTFFEDGAPVAGASVRRGPLGSGYNSIPFEGGHAHSPPSSNYGTMGPAGWQETDSSGSVTFTITPSSNAAGLLYPQFQFVYGGVDWTDQTCNGILFSMTGSTFPYMNTTSSDFELVGSTATHPYNHHGRAWFIALLEAIASYYKQEYSSEGYKLAFNDISLLHGGVFDWLNNQFTGSHYYHHLGEHVDLRTNGGNSVPNDASVRLWLSNLIHTVLGYYPYDETDHWHLCGNAIGPCGG